MWMLGKTFKIVQYLHKIIPNLHDMIDNHTVSGEWKLQLMMKINFMSPKDDNEKTTDKLKMISKKLWLKLIDKNLLNYFLIPFCISRFGIIDEG